MFFPNCHSLLYIQQFVFSCISSVVLFLMIFFPFPFTVFFPFDLLVEMTPLISICRSFANFFNFLIKVILILIFFLFFYYLFDLFIVITIPYVMIEHHYSILHLCYPGLIYQYKMLKQEVETYFLVPFLVSSLFLSPPLILCFSMLPFHMANQSLDRCQIT